ncbi:hypothetical protein QLQ15_06135 [Lysobacter sp. LF1]|uniref:Transmembrane protein n=1 Tax=Lysobacter stagni TaxID=3045172 RepID=A0ABT6XEC3_9GAMM|nr:hypothetical protein [Lysobacter sp. LF1]MDI9238491.1 hypothetical protein [Lysobacter sp. LF1]
MKTTRTDIDPGLEGLLRHAVAIGAAIVVLLPAARGFSPTFGWMPLWLLAMPACAWWALHRFRLPVRETDEASASVLRPRRRAGTQARRRRASVLRLRRPQAA